MNRPNQMFTTTFQKPNRYHFITTTNTRYTRGLDI